MLSSDSLVFDSEVHSETLEIDDNQENKDGGKKGGDVRCVRAIESLLQRDHIVALCEKAVEQRHKSTLEFSSLPSLDRCGTEGLRENERA